MNNKRSKILIFAIIIILIIAAVSYFKVGEKKPYTIEKTASSKELISAKEAYNLVYGEAKKWQTDVQLVSLKSSGELIGGKSGNWLAEFYSKSYTASQGGSIEKLTKYNYQIFVSGKKIEKTQIAESGAWGSGLPSVWRDSPDVAEQFLSAANFKNEKIKELNLYYDLAFQKWFWAIRTDKGVTGVEVK